MFLKNIYEGHLNIISFNFNVLFAHIIVIIINLRSYILFFRFNSSGNESLFRIIILMLQRQNISKGQPIVECDIIRLIRRLNGHYSITVG